MLDFKIRKRWKMENKIENFKLNPLTDSKFISTALATYEQNGIKKNWEIVQAHDSVAILIYHKEHKSFILVKQFRPAVYLNNSDGMTVELCAGIVDESMKVSEGGGVAGELIEVIHLPLTEAKALIYDETIAKTPGLMFAFMWWFENNS